MADERPHRQPRHRAVALAALLAVLIGAYLASLFALDLAHTPTERRLGDLSGAADTLEVYLNPLSLDVTDESMQLRIYVTPAPAFRGRADIPTHDVELELANDGATQLVVFHAGQPAAPQTVLVDLDQGSVVAYPLDRYRTDLRLRARLGDVSVPVAVTVWEQILGYRVAASSLESAGTGEVALRLDMRRADAQVFFALAAYASMAVVACCALAISGLVFLERRKVEAALTCALGPLVFALPVLRNALPGGPPLGVHADVAVFLWAELATVIALALFVVAWARQR